MRMCLLDRGVSAVRLCPALRSRREVLREGLRRFALWFREVVLHWAKGAPADLSLTPSLVFVGTPFADSMAPRRS